MPYPCPIPVCSESADPAVRGLRLLAAGNPGAAACAFREVIEADPERSLGYAGLAVALAELDPGREPSDEVVHLLGTARRKARGHARRERQRVAIIELVLDGALPRASALAREHLGEFPEDRIVLEVVARRCPDLDDLFAG